MEIYILAFSTVIVGVIFETTQVVGDWSKVDEQKVYPHFFHLTFNNVWSVKRNIHVVHITGMFVLVRLIVSVVAQLIDEDEVFRKLKSDIGHVDQKHGVVVGEELWDGEGHVEVSGDAWDRDVQFDNERVPNVRWKCELNAIYFIIVWQIEADVSKMTSGVVYTSLMFSVWKKLLLW